jgi:hypothetical protein
MATLLDRGSTFLRAKLPKVAKQVIAYRRGIIQIDELEAVQSNSETESYTVEDAEGTFRSVDWYIEAAQLAIDGLLVEPQRGDEIRRTNEQGRVEVYVVLPIPGGRVFEQLDERVGLLYRVHSKFVRSELPEE